MQVREPKNSKLGCPPALPSRGELRVPLEWPIATRKGPGRTENDELARPIPSGVLKNRQPGVRITQWQRSLHACQRKTGCGNGASRSFPGAQRRVPIERRPRAGRNRAPNRTTHTIVLKIEDYIVPSREKTRQKQRCHEELPPFTAPTAETIDVSKDPERPRQVAILAQRDEVNERVRQQPLYRADVRQGDRHVAHRVHPDRQQPPGRRAVWPWNRLDG